MDEISVACLVEIKSGEMRRAHIIGRESFLIGRSKDAAIPILTVNSSRHHVRVDIGPQSVEITDLNSNNGTFVDGARIKPNVPTKIKSSSVVQLGGSSEEYKFSLLPMPIELLSIEQRREILLNSMNEIRNELESKNLIALENQKLKMLAEIRHEQERSITFLNAELNEKRKQTDDEIRKITDRALVKAHESAAKIKSEAESEAQSTVREAIRRAQMVNENAQAQASEMARDAQRKYNETLEMASAKSEEIQKLEREKIKLRAENDAQIFLNEHKSELEFKKKSFDAEMQNRREVEIENIRKITLQEQESVIAAHRDLINKLKNDKNNFEKELQSLQSKCSQLKSDEKELSASAEKMSRRHLEVSSQVSSIQEKLNEAHATIAKAEEAEKYFIELSDKSRAAQNNYEHYQKSFEDGMLKIEREFQAKKEKATLEYDEMLKKKEEEYAKSLLETMNKLKNKILEEEKKYFTTQQLRGVELAKSIEAVLLPSVSEHFKSKNISLDLGLISKIIYETVTRTVEQGRSSIQAVTEHLGDDFEKNNLAKEKHKRWAMLGAVAAVLAAIYYWEPIYSYFEDMQVAPGYVDYLVAKKSAESVYAPPQDDLWRETYAGNILYLRNYFEAKTEPAYSEQWAILLNDVDFVRSMNLSEDDIVQFLGKEASLVAELWSIRQSLDAKYLEEGLGKMNAAEVKAIEAFKEVLKTEDNYEKIRKRERDFTSQFIHRRYGTSKRVPTSD